MGTWYAKNENSWATNNQEDKVICWYTGFTLQTFI